MRALTKVTTDQGISLRLNRSRMPDYDAPAVTEPASAAAGNVAGVTDDTAPAQPEIEFRSDVTVELVRSSASDSDVLFAARVSTQGEQTLEDAASGTEATARDRGLINYLMRDRHGSPFEHNSMTFYVQAPIFVFREFMRHRIASYNEESGRYRELRPVFYVPAPRAQPPAGRQARCVRVPPRQRGAVRARRRGDAGCRDLRLRRISADAGSGRRS